MLVPEFTAVDFLRTHIKKTMDFYHPQCIDPNGGFFHFFKDNGVVYDTQTRHLVSSTRFIFNYAKAFTYFKDPSYFDALNHGVDFLRQKHRLPNGGYAWLLKENDPVDATNHCYGLAFVLLAYSVAYQAGIERAKPWISETFDLLETYFWDNEYELYLDEISSDWRIVSPYRGQNANMHTCEALIAAFDATSNSIYLKRAQQLAEHICIRQAALGGGQIWEHYTQDWQIDWDYNKQNPKHLFRPWGFQPGHQTEWSKLLMMLHHREANEQFVQLAMALFDQAWTLAWDDQHHGLCYGYAPDGCICDGDKYFWVQAESFAAAAWLAVITKEDKYWQAYQLLWQYSWDHMIDHQYGAWYRILTQDNQAIDDCKSPAGKTDYHTMGACYEVISLLSRSM